MAPVVWMLASTIIYGLYPLVAFTASTVAHPIFLIAVAHGAATLIQLIGVMASARKERTTATELFRAISPFNKIFKWAIIQGAIHSIAHISLFAAFIYLDKYAAALIYDAWPILMIIIAAPLLPGRFLPSAKEWLFISVSFAGLLIIISSKVDFSGQVSGISSFFQQGAGIGAAIAFVSMVGMAVTAVAAVRLESLCLAAYRYRAAHRSPAEGRNSRVVGGKEKPYSTAILSPFLGNAFSMIFSAIIATLYFLFSREEAVRGLSIGPVLGLGVLAGAIAAMAQICFIIANRSTKLTSINVLYNLTPLFGILFLYIFGANETIAGQVLLGGMLVIAANMAIGVHAEITLAYDVSIVAICFSAVYCFFIPGLDIDAYYSAIAIPAGIFAILIAFMTERLSVRQLRQEDIAIKIFEVFEKKRPESVSRESLREAVAQILVSRSAQQVRETAADFIDSNKTSFPEVSSLMASLATNRLRIFGFGEIFVLWLIGIATVGLAVFGRPANVEANMLAVVLSATIAFLCVLVVEPVNSRRASLLFGLLGELPRSEIGFDRRIKRDVDFLIMSCTSAVFAGILFFLFFIAIVQNVQ